MSSRKIKGPSFRTLSNAGFIFFPFRGVDLAPGQQSLASEAIPKSLSRVLNAAQIRGDWKEHKRKLENGEPDERGSKRRKTTDGEVGTGKKSKALGIQPGESLQHFNKFGCSPLYKLLFDNLRLLIRRVEDDMRPLVRNAARGAQRVDAHAKALSKSKKKTGKQNVADDTDEAPSLPKPPKHADRPKEFQTMSSSAPRRLNDIAQAPPEFKKPPVRSDKVSGTSRKDAPGLSMAQKAMMEEEREKAIIRYRQMKAKRVGDGGDRDRTGPDDDDDDE